MVENKCLTCSYEYIPDIKEKIEKMSESEKGLGIHSNKFIKLLIRKDNCEKPFIKKYIRLYDGLVPNKVKPEIQIVHICPNCGTMRLEVKE